MRKLPAAALLALLVPALCALPVLTAPVASARPVTPELRSVALSGVDPSSLAGSVGKTSAAASDAAWREAEAAVGGAAGVARAAGPRVATRPTVLTPARRTSSFSMIGVTWRKPAGDQVADATVVVRTHNSQGWTGWSPLEAQDGESDHDPGSRAGTEPLWVGRSDGYQVRMDVRSGIAPGALRVNLVDPGSSPADASVGGGRPAASASAAVAQPTIYTRAQWGADESMRGSGPNYTPTIKAGFVHHTDSANNYSMADTAKVIRGIYAYHTKANGWSDIGYNFLVDRFGRLWEGRYGGMSKAVLGAHTGGFNDDSFAVSAIGNFDKVKAPASMVDAIARVMAWKLSLYYRNPTGTTTLTSVGGGTSRYPAGRTVTFNVISGHRDAGLTACPGRNLYSQLPTIRTLTSQYLGAALVSPTLSSSLMGYAANTLTVSARTTRVQSWSATILDHWTGTTVRTLTGTATPTKAISARWDGRDAAGNAARPGTYDVVLRSWDDTSSARSWTRTFTIEAPSVSPPVVKAAPLPGASTFVPTTPQRVYDTRTGGRLPLGPGQRLDLKVLGTGPVPATDVGAVALTVTAGRPTKSTWLWFWPAGARRPNVANTFVPFGTTRTSTTVVPVGGDGKVSIADNGGSTELAVDVAGYFPTTPVDPTAQTLHAVTPFRLYDSRKDPAGILGAGTGRTLTMPAQGTVTPDQMTGLVVNVTTVGATGDGTVTLRQPGAALPARAFTTAYAAGPARATRAFTALSRGGTFRVDNRGSATHVVVDVVGYYAPDSVPGGTTFHATTTTRVLDTRTGLGGRRTPLGAGRTMTLAVAGTGKVVPATATTVLLSLNALTPTRNTIATAWQAGLARPTASDLNATAGTYTTNLLVVQLGTGTRAGKISLSSSAGSTHFAADVLGYWS